VRVFGDCGDKKFDPNVPFKLVPTVLVRATLHADSITPQPFNTQPRINPTGFVNVDTGVSKIKYPATAAIHMNATVDVVSGGAGGARAIERVFAGWVNNVVADVDWLGSYQNVHSLRAVFATNDGTGPVVEEHGIFQPGDRPELVKPAVSDTAPLLDAGWPNAGTGGGTATLSNARIVRFPNLPFLGERWFVQAVDSPGTGFPLLHPVFSTAANPVRLQGILFELHFSAHLCLWTNRSGNVGDVAERSYGVLRSYKWDMRGVWSIDAANKPIVVTPMAITISGGVTRDPLARPNSAGCEVCSPAALSLIRRDGSI
jgi:hypothetical protein